MRIGISGYGAIAPLGEGGKWSDDVVWLTRREHMGGSVPVGSVPDEVEGLLEDLRGENKEYKYLDRSVLLAILASRRAMKQAGWQNDSSVAVNMGSSRGATQLFEEGYGSFISVGEKKISVRTSPSTTLGNISSWVAQDLELKGWNFSHSITCSTAMHALANAFAWIRSRMAERMLVGGSEAPLTPFTIEQMRALKIYSEDRTERPCMPFSGTGGMVLGEGAGVLAVEELNERSIVEIKGIGFGMEKIGHPASLSEQGDCLVTSMTQAVQEAKVPIDLIVCHAPGTKQGDLSELNAMSRVFGNELPEYWSNKWKIGHTLGASGALSIASAVEFITENIHPFHPPANELKPAEKRINNVLVNSVGFGGNAVSAVISSTDQAGS